MADYIKREDAIRAVEKHPDENYDLKQSERDGLIMSEIDNLPSADVVEVVRCKDCKYYVPISEKIGECKDTRMTSTYMSYCSYGERKE